MKFTLDNVNICDEFFELFFLLLDALTSNVIQTRALNPLHFRRKSMEFVREINFLLLLTYQQL